MLNCCDDCYGGLVVNCVCFFEDIVDVVGGVMLLSCVGVCILLYVKYNNVCDVDLDVMFVYVGWMFDVVGVVYLYVVDINGWSGEFDLLCIVEYVCWLFYGMLIVNGGILLEVVSVLIDVGDVDFVVFVCVYIVNLDFVECIVVCVLFVELKIIGWYGGECVGYVDYVWYDVV